MNRFKKVFIGMITTVLLLSTFSVVKASVQFPKSVDNSELGCFPPIGDQGSLGSCQAFASTYYQFTHMLGLSRNTIANSNSRIMSPKWVFNFYNSSYPYNLLSAFGVLDQVGCASWAEFPYQNDVDNRELCLDSNIWRSALNNRIDQRDRISFCPSTEEPLVTSVDDSDLAEVKTFLSNGYVLSFGTFGQNWNISKVGNDPTTEEDDRYVGENICMSNESGVFSDGHFMTVVGYNDNIWVDINGDGDVSIGEKGAFKIANSWGENCSDMNSGFCWLAYDTINIVSSVTGATRRCVFNDGYLYWMTAKDFYSPKVLAKFTINHAKREQVRIEIGCSETNTNKATEWLRFKSFDGDFAFDGTSTACDGTFVMDVTKLVNKYNLDDGSTKRWYIRAMDCSEDGNPLVLKNFQLQDSYGNILANTGDINISTESPRDYKIVYLDCVAPTSLGSWSTKTNIPYPKAFNSSVSFRKNIYIMGGCTLDNLNATKSVYAYNPSTQSYTQGTDMNEARKSFAAASLFSKIYAVGGKNSSNNYLSSMEAYDPMQETWKNCANMTIPRRDLGVAVVNNKLYAIGGESNGSVVGTVEEYDPVTDEWTTKASMPTARSCFATAVVNNKIYAIGGQDSGYNRLNIVEEYNPLLDTWNTVPKNSMPTARWGLTCIVKGDRIFAIGGNASSSDVCCSKVEEYNPYTNTWKTKTNMTTGRNFPTSGVIDDKIYIIGGNAKSSNVYTSSIVECFTE